VVDEWFKVKKLYDDMKSPDASGNTFRQRYANRAHPELHHRSNNCIICVTEEKDALRERVLKL